MAVNRTAPSGLGKKLGVVAGGILLAGAVAYGVLAGGTATVGAVGIGATLGFIGGFAGGLVSGQSLSDSVELGTLGAGLGAIAVLLPAATVFQSMAGGAAGGFVTDVVGQLASGQKFNPYSTLFNTALGGLVGAGVGAVIPGGAALGAGLDQTIVQTIVGGPIALAAGVGYAAGVPSP